MSWAGRGTELRSRLQRLAAIEADPLCAEFHRVGWIGYVMIQMLVLVDDLRVFKTGGAHGADKLCVQQSAGNSTRPQGDVVERVGGHLPFHQNIAGLQAPARLEDAEPLAQSLGLVECEV